MAVNLGQQLLDANGPGGRFVINNLVGLAIQLNALGAMDPASPYGRNSRPDGPGLRGPTHATESGHQTALHPRPKALGSSAGKAYGKTCRRQTLSAFSTAKKLYGEQAALQWYFNKR